MIWEWLKTKKPHVVILKLRCEDDITVINGKTLEIYYLNKTAGIILSLCDGKRDLGEIEKEMLLRFQVDPEILRNDLISLVRDLQWKRILILE